MMESSRYELKEENEDDAGPSSNEVESMIDRFVLEANDEKADEELKVFNEAMSPKARARGSEDSWLAQTMMFFACGGPNDNARQPETLNIPEELLVRTKSDDKPGKAAAVDLSVTQDAEPELASSSRLRRRDDTQPRSPMSLVSGLRQRSLRRASSGEEVEWSDRDAEGCGLATL